MNRLLNPLENYRENGRFAEICKISVSGIDITSLACYTGAGLRNRVFFWLTVRKTKSLPQVRTGQN